MPDLLKRLEAGADRGFSMFLTIMAMLLTTMFVAAAFAAANGDLPMSGIATERKSTYAATEAGLNFYLNQLQLDPDYWTKCDTGPAPNATELNPVNQVWNGVGNDTRRWRSLPGSTDEYTIELIPAPGSTKCDSTKQSSFVDMTTGTFKIKVTGRSYKNAKRTRSIIATFRRDSFLNFVYFTDYESRDPAAEPDATDRKYQQDNCAEKYRTARKNLNCSEIQFATGDKINGPLHTNDESLLICGSPVFGRTTEQDLTTPRAKTDTIEVRGGGTGHVANPAPTNPTCTDTPTINAPDNVFSTKAKMLALPDSNQTLEQVATNSNSRYTGKTSIRLRGSVMDITNNGVTKSNLLWPSSGVIYVAGTGGSCTGEVPTDADYNEETACGNVYVSGTYNAPLTIAAARDIIVAPTGGSGFAGDANLIQGGNDATLGLIANNFVRVAHRVSSCANVNTTQYPQLTNVTIEAAILSLQHSFIVDNYQCGKRGTLNVTGAIVQKYRGPVGTGTATSVSSGYLKNYWYDDRFRYRSPPYFLTPVDASWDVVRVHEYVKGN
jgi:hypothetical protein